MTPLVSKLLEKAGLLEKQTFMSFPNDLLREGGLSSMTNYDHELMRDTFKYAEVYRKVDSSEKYGDIFLIVYVHDEPVLFANRHGKWLDSYCCYHLNDDKTAKFEQAVKSIQIREDWEDKDYMTDEKLQSEEWFGKYDLLNEELPIVIPPEQY